ncbi:cell wall hydrolase [Novosphingobium sp. JCM 18896]|uniref:cell wall hydrolase n=1 Tax=Novosphingobium sp. JCM 18896 TaxID=2989731 RepID=UPI00222303BC|nr:cell wall hydrolase [Novosphingobium sp. JCM 18896]MCW1429259.1 cell wall hydrolase [Novosphingobium sp. JCM 18896]
MKFKLFPASTVAVVATLVTALASAQGSGAVAQDKMFQPVQMEPLLTISQPVIQPLPGEAQVQSADAAPQDDEAEAPAATLAELVSDQETGGELSPEMRCLAGAIYFEAKSESLPGQLAVGRVVVNRSKSGRFPASYCGVVYQPSQFSFVRGRSMPAINTGSQDWREAVAIARIADAGSWRSSAEGALFFHAARVSPGWRLARVTRIDNHVFYR